MRAGADGRIAHRDLHLARLRRDCRAVGFPLDMAAVGTALDAVPAGAELRLRLSVDQAGRIAIERAPRPDNPAFWRVAVAGPRLCSGDPWLRVKTSHRPVYDAARAALAPGVDEAILLNERDEICEGSITSLFLRRGGVLLTPPLSSGLLPGVLRAALIASGAAREAVLRRADLDGAGLLCGNALRGLIPARLVAT
ncbi:aminotransferase class IV [Paracoccus spongiarum]|uniref:Probable branched-chain-amino-acid aminotransferase n=1 Tax=Paracoccus spongiarum TaxID=3064387 RepID=A0ABT9J9B6_9RHOB|nr:aminotransferase class IV [Paracoccus sp. 2205BS29-5]MDP5306401.1 aminotransferase class IV [Paracoccus sp. 2205BS29-5]